VATEKQKLKCKI